MTTSKLKKAILTNFTADNCEAKFLVPRFLFCLILKPIAPKNLLLENFFFFIFFGEKLLLENLSYYRKFYAKKEKIILEKLT